MLQVIINVNRHNQVQIRLFFKKTRLTLLKYIYFHFKTATKQMIMFFDQG